MSSSLNNGQAEIKSNDVTRLIWTDTHPIQLQAIDTTAAVVEFNGSIYMAYKAEDGTNYIWMARSDDGGNSWDWWVNRGHTTTAGPSLAVFNNKYLYLVYKGNSNGEAAIYMSRSEDGKNWQHTKQIEKATTTTKPAVAAFQHSLYVIHKHGSSDQLRVSVSADGDNWHTADITNFFTNAGPAVAEFPYNGELYVAYKAYNSDEIRLVATQDGVNWHGRELNGYLTKDSPALAFFNDSLYLVYKNADSSQLFLTRTVDGAVWEQKQAVAGQTTSAGPALAAVKSNIFLVYKAEGGSHTPFITHSQGAIKYFTGDEVEARLTKLNQGILVKRYLKGSTLYRSLLKSTVQEQWIKSEVWNWFLEPATFDRIDFAICVKGQISKWIKFHSEHPAAGAFGILWGKRTGGDNIAYNFYINPFGILKVFDPKTGEDSDVFVDWKAEFAMF